MNARNEVFPSQTIEQAIAKARQYAAANEIDLSGKYIKAAEYINERDSDGDRPFWRIYWINRKITKGGSVEVKLYSDDSIEVRYWK